MVKDYQIYRHITYTHNLDTQTYLSLGFPSISSSNIMSTGNTYIFNFQPMIPIQTTDILVITAKRSLIGLTASTITSLGSSFMYLYLKAGWIVLQPSSLISTASVTSFSITSLNNPNYVSLTAADYTVSFMHWNGLTSTRNTGV